MPVIVAATPNPRPSTVQAVACTQWPRPTSSLRSFVAMFVPAKPAPAAIISAVALSHRVRLSANGSNESAARNAATPRTVTPPR
jgi:hypothetical protein